MSTKLSAAERDIKERRQDLSTMDRVMRTRDTGDPFNIDDDDKLRRAPQPELTLQEQQQQQQEGAFSGSGPCPYLLVFDSCDVLNCEFQHQPTCNICKIDTFQEMSILREHYRKVHPRQMEIMCNRFRAAGRNVPSEVAEVQSAEDGEDAKAAAATALADQRPCFVCSIAACGERQDGGPKFYDYARYENHLRKQHKNELDVTPTSSGILEWHRTRQQQQRDAQNKRLARRDQERRRRRHTDVLPAQQQQLPSGNNNSPATTAPQQPQPSSAQRQQTIENVNNDDRVARAVCRCNGCLLTIASKQRRQRESDAPTGGGEP